MQTALFTTCYVASANSIMGGLQGSLSMECALFPKSYNVMITLGGASFPPPRRLPLIPRTLHDLGLGHSCPQNIDIKLNMYRDATHPTYS